MNKKELRASGIFGPPIEAGERPGLEFVYASLGPPGPDFQSVGDRPAELDKFKRDAPVFYLAYVFYQIKNTDLWSVEWFGRRDTILIMRTKGGVR